MQALRIQKDAKEATVVSIPIPDIGPQDVLVQVKAVGLAPGPFSLLRLGRLSHLPMTLGHEIAGIVAEKGKDVESVTAGTPVRIHPSICCRSCEYCLQNKGQMCSKAGIVGSQFFGGEDETLFERYKLMEGSPSIFEFHTGW